MITRKTLVRPTVELGISEIQWESFKKRWNIFKSGSGATNAHLFYCCEKQLSEDLLKHKPDITNASEEEMLNAIKNLAVIKRAKVVQTIREIPSGVCRALDLILLDQSYVSGWSPCQLDWEVYKSLPPPSPTVPNLQRWHAHIGSFSQAELQLFKPTDMTLTQLVVYGILNNKKIKTPHIAKVKKRKGGKNDVPDRWEAYCKIGSVVEGTLFIPFKVPLKQGILNKVSQEVDNKWRVEDVIEAVPAPGLGLVIDLTFTTRYYDPKIFTSNDIKHKKILTAGHGVPGKDVVDEFTEAVDSLLAEEGDKLIGVHCTHGLNRTGYLVCRYMIQNLGIEPEVAMAAFDKARGHKQERANYIEHLKTLKVKSM